MGPYNLRQDVLHVRHMTHQLHRVLRVRSSQLLGRFPRTEFLEKGVPPWAPQTLGKVQELLNEPNGRPIGSEAADWS